MAKKMVEKVVEIEASVPKDYRISYWYTKISEMSEGEQEHVRELLEQGFTCGELLYDANGGDNRGWWHITKGKE